MENTKPISPLYGSVLVLNRFYMAVHVVSVRRALVLLYGELAEVIHVDKGHYHNYDFHSWVELGEYILSENDLPHGGSEWIRGVNRRIQVPRVLRLYRYDRVPRLSLRFNRRNVFARDSHRCQYCTKCYPINQLSFDHVIPRSRGGQTTWENVVCCCLRCNSKKGNRTPDEAGLRLVRRPGKPKQNPLLSMKLDNPKYESWRNFLQGKSLAMEV